MMNKGVKGRLAEGTGEGELLAEITQGGESHNLSLLYGGGAALINSGGTPLDGGLCRYDRRTDGRFTIQHRCGVAGEDHLRTADQCDR
jgi:hypothetical protein